MRAVLLVPVLLIAACASTQDPLPANYTGPSAIVADTCVAESGSKAQCFVILEVAGKPIRNATIESQQASAGKGFALTTRNTARRLPAESLTVKLKGTHQTAAPIHEIASRAAGTFFTVEGVVKFTPEPDVIYRVKGELSKEASSIWIEEANSGKVVTEKVTAKQ